MLYYKLNGYEDFKHRFGLESRNNGTTVRKNRILLGHLKNPLLLDYCVKQNDYTLLYVEDMADLQKKVAEAVRKSGMEDDRLSNEVELIGEVYRSARYRTDESKGICDDLDKNSVRYVNVEKKPGIQNEVRKIHEGTHTRNQDRKNPVTKRIELDFRGRVHTTVVHLYLRTHTRRGRTLCER